MMSNEVKYCFEDDDTRDVAHNMAEIQVRRLPLINRDKRLIGIIALGDIALTEAGRPAGEALSGISELGGSHSQTGRERTCPLAARAVRTYCRAMAARNSRSSGHAQQLPSWLLMGMHAEPSFWASAGCRSGTAPSLEAVSGWHRISGAALVFRRSDGMVSSWLSVAWARMP
jgi:CBS domain